MWLVHGTFGARASFLDENSPLRQAISRHASPSGVDFRPFKWGLLNNTFFARARASRRLATLLAKASAEDPSARHVLIAHSHGGNVALKTVDQVGPQVSVAGVVTMATPFIESIARRVPLVGVMIVLLLSVAAVFTWEMLVEWILDWKMSDAMNEANLLSIMNQIENGAQFSDIPSPIQFSGLRLLAAVAYVGAAIGGAVWMNHIREGLTKEYINTAARSAKATSSVPLFVLSVASDEARGWLKTLVAICRFPARLILALGGIVLFFSMRPVLESFMSWGAMWFSPELLKFYGVQGMLTSLDNLLFALGYFAFAATAVLALYILAIEVPARLLSVLILGTQMGFGGLLFHAFQHVWTSALPSREGYKFEEFNLPAPSYRFALRHSMVYEDEKALGAIADWVAKLATASESPVETEVAAVTT